MEENKNDQHLVKAFVQLLNLVVIMLLIIIGLIAALFYYVPKDTYKANIPISASSIQENNNTNVIADQLINDTIKYWAAPDPASMENNKNKEAILYGKDLIAHTSEYFGINGKINKGYTNGMNCQNCHLDAGTKIFGNNYSAVASTYPKYRARSGKEEDIPKRINDCFERSLNGRPLKINSSEMQSIIAYIKWLGKDVPKGKKPEGSGFKDLAFLDRPANPENGRNIYIQKCQSCHQANGEGQLNSDKTLYTYPPLWGEHSYNIGAGLYRLSNFAKFIKYNMPLGVSHTNTQLTDEEAWDIAAFVNSQNRPTKDLQKDWPKIEEKPFDHPFGPYADGFDQKQHKYGPFKPIIEKISSLKKEKSKP
ncbi:MAG: c-type cytochrome [Bacteroidia bacterium]